MDRGKISLKGRTILDIDDLSVDEIKVIMQTASEMKKFLHRNIKKLPTLRGKSIVTLFYEASTRTRTSFELAGKYLSADVVNINSSASSITKGESLRDTLLTIEDMGVDAIIMRHSAEGAADYAAKIVSPVILNAGDGAHAHPSQALLNLFTIIKHKKNIKGLKIAIIGDILHSRVARSDIKCLTKMGAEVHLAGPGTLMPNHLTNLPNLFIHDFVEEAIKNADVINVLRIQLERMKSGLLPSLREYARIYGLNKNRLSLAKKDAIIMHPGPMNKGVEISSDICYGNQSVIQDQVANGVAIRMSLLGLTLSGGK